MVSWWLDERFGFLFRSYAIPQGLLKWFFWQTLKKKISTKIALNWLKTTFKQFLMILRGKKNLRFIKGPPFDFFYKILNWVTTQITDQSILITSCINFEPNDLILKLVKNWSKVHNISVLSKLENDNIIIVFHYKQHVSHIWITKTWWFKSNNGLE